MIATTRSKKMQSAFAKLGLLTLAALAVILSLAAAPQASAQVTLMNRQLQYTDFQTEPNSIAATCATVNCVAPPAPIFPPLKAVCPTSAGQKCTYYIHLESQAQISRRDSGLFQFLVDGAPALPGPTNPGGFFTFDDNDPNSLVAMPFAHSYAVVAVVTNSVNNQAHLIMVSVSCSDTNASGSCTATTGLSNLEVGVYVP